MNISFNLKVGWLEPVPQRIRHCPSPNFNARPAAMPIDVLVIHGISLPPRQFGGQYIDQLFCNTLDSNAHPALFELKGLEVSAHLLIRRDGECVQYVSFEHRAWHAGQSSFQGRTGCNDFAIGIELEGCDDIAYETAQYESLVQVILRLQSAYPQIIDNHIVGHADIAPQRKTDPGEAFDWGYLRQLLQA
jgi:AmpD protein